KKESSLREQPYPSRQWYHVAGVVTSDAGVYKLLLYINGEFKGATNALPAPVRDNTASGWVIGGSEQSSATAYLGGINFKGKICEVRLWSSSRSQTDIQASMHRRLTGTEEGLVGYWPLNDGHGDRAFDHSVGGVAAQLGDKDAGKVIPGWIPGNNPASTLPTWPSDNPTYDLELYTEPWLIPPASFGLSFDGRYNKGIAGLPSLPPDELHEATWEVWFRPDEQSGQKKVLWHEEPAGWQTIWQDGQISVGVYPGTPGESKPGPAVTQWYFASAPGDHITTIGMQWYHVAGVLGAGKLLLYIDGQVRGSVDCPPFETGLFNLYKSGLNIGSGTRTGEGFNFKGQISEVRLWKIARRQQDIAASMHSRLAGNEEGLVGYWPLTEGYGTTAYDHSGHGFTAHLGDEGAALTIPTWLPGNAAGGPALQTPSGSFLMQ
ncbi:MAG TPA: LamG-like jellyroll fold domain-containing protein, partial [Ktedonobacteraceae bacterium]|nr:LamG-like jellyroll fold domain-containing protein [Ktedonobacteraceae bacterium]